MNLDSLFALQDQHGGAGRRCLLALLLLSLLPACGQTRVQSAKPDAGKVDGAATDSNVSMGDGSLLDALNVDGRVADLASTDLPVDLNAACRQSAVMLRTAGDFVVLAGSTVTNTGLTMVAGNLGVSPGTSVTGFGPGAVTAGAQHAGDGTAAQAQSDLTTAYNDAAGRVLCPISISGNLGGMTLAPGLYKSTTSLEITSGDLVLDGHGDPDAVFIFQMASTLITTSGRQVTLIRGARAANVFWQVGSSATLGSTSVMYGTIMADQAITLETGAAVTGRLLARIAEVALDANTIGPPPP